MVNPFDGPADVRRGPPRRSAAIVLAGGIATTVLTGALVEGLHLNELLRLFWPLVIPTGAMVVGAAATSGYSLAAFVGGCRLRGWLLYVVIALSIAAYLGLVSLEFRHADASAHQAGFLAWFDANARAMRFRYGGTTSGALGGTGYWVVALQAAGFCAGAVVMPLAMSRAPYCEPCARYYRSRRVAVISAGVTAGGEDNTVLARNRAAFKLATERMGALLDAAEAGDRPAWKATLDAAFRDPGDMRRRKIELRLVHCPSCARGYLRADANGEDGFAELASRPLGTDAVCWLRDA
jgi:hypothetical protein